MPKIELGFEGERFLYIPNPQISLMEDSPLTSDLYIYSLGYFSRAAHHYINRPNGCDEFLLIYCKKGCGWIELYNKKQKLETIGYTSEVVKLISFQKTSINRLLSNQTHCHE